MEIQAFAHRILASPLLEDKLQPPPSDLTDLAPGEPQHWTCPVRLPEHQFADRRKRSKMPAPGSLGDPIRRAITLHHFANHELMALELFAAALLAFPTMPAPFRRGLLVILADEQRHFRLYQTRMEALGMRFGDRPLNDHFWRVAGDLDSPLKFVAAMALTFENGNLDYAQQYAAYFRTVGDMQSANIMDQVHDDELMHVRFGVHWLRRLKEPQQSDWEAYTGALVFPTTPARAKGLHFDRIAREVVGLDRDFIDRLEAYQIPRLEALSPRYPAITGHATDAGGAISVDQLQHRAQES